MHENLNMSRFTDQVAIITGGANGIGRACATRFAAEGAHIATLDIDTTENKITAEICKRYGVQAVAISCDVAQKKQLATAVEKIILTWGKIDILVCSAGIYSGSPLADVEEDQWQKSIQTNLTGTFLTNQMVVAHMQARKTGSIINISSMAGKTSWPATAEYSASKSGIIGLTRSVAMETAADGITANVICPGNTRTNMVHEVSKVVGPAVGMQPDEWLDMRAADCPMQRIAEPWEIAGVAAFLASRDARYITGQSLEVDGGMILS